MFSARGHGLSDLCGVGVLNLLLCVVLVPGIWWRGSSPSSEMARESLSRPPRWRKASDTCVHLLWWRVRNDVGTLKSDYSCYL